MEFDNDRAIKPIHPIEIGCWIAIALLNPLVNALTAFPTAPKAWPLLLVSNVLVLPVYLFLSRVIVPRFLFTRRIPLFSLLTSLLLACVLLLLFMIYRLLLSAGADGRSYFNYSALTVSREICWTIINATLATAIAWLKTTLDKQEKVNLLQKDNSFYKLRYLRSQLNPHFLFNTLNSIYSLAMSKSDKAPDVIIRLSDIMRFLIYECNEDRIPINKEIEFIQNYIEIERLRYDADIRLTIEGKTDNVWIEPFLFISFIENGFKHAIDNAGTRPFIYITLKVKPDSVTLNVINNTSEELEAQAKKVSGKGLETSRNVLELLYPEAYALDIIQTEKKQRKESRARFKNAQERLQRLYPDSHTLDVILNNNTFTVSLIVSTT